MTTDGNDGEPKDGDEFASLMRGNHPDDENNLGGTADRAAGFEINIEESDDDQEEFEEEQQQLEGGGIHGPPRRRQSRWWFLAILIVPAMFAFIYTLRRRNFAMTRTTEEDRDRNSALAGGQCVKEYTFNTSWEEYQTIVGGWNASDRCSPELDQVRSTAIIDRECGCTNPLIATKPSLFQQEWKFAKQKNLKLIDATKGGIPLDVVMVGDSFTEHWYGTDLGYPNPNYLGNREAYESLFDKTKGGTIQGLALGIGGDRCGQLLYRLQHGEMPDFLQPAVWWVLIGNTDHGRDHCNDDIIAVGVIRVVREIRTRRPNATVVINSILPKGKKSLVDESNLAWRSLSRVNERLECYAAGSTDGKVEFFNGTDLFLTDDKTHVNLTLTAGDDWHPSGIGSRIWGNAIVDRVQEIKRNNHRLRG